MLFEKESEEYKLLVFSRVQIKIKIVTIAHAKKLELATEASFENKHI